MFIHAWSGINLQDNPKSMIFKKFFSIGSCNCSCCMTATSPSANLCHLGHGPTDHGQITTNHHILGPWSWRESFRAWDPDEQSYSRAYSRWHLGLHESCCKPFTKAKDSHGFPWIPRILSVLRIICCMRIAACTCHKRNGKNRTELLSGVSAPQASEKCPDSMIRSKSSPPAQSSMTR